MSAAATTVDLRTRVGDVELRSPVMTASGTAGHGAELGTYVDLSSLGAVVVKSVSTRPWEGNPAPRLLPLKSGMLNSVGLQNPGIDEWLKRELPEVAATGARVVASIWGFSAREYLDAAGAIASAVARGLEGTDSLVAVEANISCPNVEDRRRMFAHSVAGVSEAVGASVEGLSGRLPLWAKLSPNVTDITEMAGAARSAGASAVTVINTVMGMSLDPATGKPRLGGGGGGLSGPAVHAVAVRAVYECRAAFDDLPIVGVGGVTNGEEAAEMIAAGADAVQVGTATFADPRAPAKILAGLAMWCDRNGISRIDQLKGRAHDSR